MTRILFVRHGQASAGASDYDALSHLGREQARQLGHWLGKRGRAPTHVLVGPRRRHLDTWLELEAGYRAERSDHALPIATRLDALDEHHGVQLLALLGPTLAARTDAIGVAAQRVLQGPNPKRAYVDLLLRALPAWARGELTHPSVESWPDFLARIRTLPSKLAQLGDNANVWAITSGGLIATLVGDTLGASVETMFELMWATRNTALTEMSTHRTAEESGAPRLSLFSFNGLPHLEDEAHVTFV